MGKARKIETCRTEVRATLLALDRELHGKLGL